MPGHDLIAACRGRISKEVQGAILIAGIQPADVAKLTELTLNWERLAADIESASGLIQTMAAIHFRPRKVA